jgi:glycosidase
MQWDATNNAGFSTAAKTWLWIPGSSKQVNVASETKDPNSIFNWYKKLIALRRSNVAVRDGKYVTVNPDDPNVLSFLRQSGDTTVLVALNMSAQPQTLAYDLGAQGVKTTSGQILMAAPAASSKSVNLKKATIPAFGVLIAEVK